MSLALLFQERTYAAKEYVSLKIMRGAEMKVLKTARKDIHRKDNKPP